MGSNAQADVLPGGPASGSLRPVPIGNFGAARITATKST
jgi:hypothetical protein